LIPNHQALGPNQSLREALVIMRRHRQISYFPVLDPEQPDQLFGVLRQNDVLAAFRSFDTEID